MRRMHTFVKFHSIGAALIAFGALTAEERDFYPLVTKQCSDCCVGGIYQTPGGTLVDFTNEDCIAHHESKNDKKVKIKSNATCISHRKLCSLLSNFQVDSYAPVIYPGQLTLVQDPPFDPPLAPGLPGDFPPPVVNNPISMVGKNVVVIGGSRGAGKAIADRFYAEGANVIATSRYPECYPKRDYPLRRLDIRYEDSVSHFIEKLIKKIKKIDVLVIVAGTVWNGPMQQATGDEIMSHFNATVFGWHRVVQKALPYMRHSNDTRVISTGSTVSYFSWGYTWGPYNMQQIAKDRWNDTLQAEEMLNKARGITQYGPTFTLMRMASLVTTIGEYEYFQAKSLKANDPALLVAGLFGASISLVGNAPPPVAPDPIVGEAIFRVATAPQPGIRYLVYGSTQTIILELIELANILPANDLLNLLNGAFTPFLAPASLESTQQTLIQTICPPPCAQ